LERRRKHGPRCAGLLFTGRANGINQYKGGIPDDNDDGHAYEAVGSDGLLQIPVENALARFDGGHLSSIRYFGSEAITVMIQP
jgi:hypothetical protein